MHSDVMSDKERSKHSSIWLLGAPVYLRIAFSIAIVAILVGLYKLLSVTGLLEVLKDSSAIQDYILQLGYLGPLIVIILMTCAIVFSPLPSAPIALAAGAVFGHTWGTIYVLVGAEMGALIAFSIARLLGYELMHKWFGDRLSMKLLGSQNTLMAIVFSSRLMPFISFDLVSYAAGLTALSFWRFALATLAGIIPASFLLAHFGGEMITSDVRLITISAIVLGSVTVLPIIIRIVKNRRSKKKGFNS